MQRRITDRRFCLAGNDLLRLIELTSRDGVLKTRLGHGMQWYVYLITILTAAFLGQIAVELIARPIRKVTGLRRTVLKRMIYFRNISLPRPRELAISSREIREYDHAVKNVRAAQRTFRDLGAQLLAFSENEPAVRQVMALFGTDIAQAGHELINLSEIYSLANTGRYELRRDIENAFCAISATLTASRHSSSDDLTKIRLEPIHSRAALPLSHRHLVKSVPVQKRTYRQALGMSVLPSRADIVSRI